MTKTAQKSIASCPSMILAAGKGTRMGSISDHTPKPLVKVAGKAMLDHSLAAIEKANLGPTVVNIHHLADVMQDHLKQRVQDGTVMLSPETDLLETGGGVKHALPQLASDKILVINGDAMWLDSPMTDNGLLHRLWQAFDAEKMDILLACYPREDAYGYEGMGDINMADATKNNAQPISLRAAASPEPASHILASHILASDIYASHIFAGVMVLNPAIYQNTPQGAWSNKLLFQRAEQQGRLYGLLHHGKWMHVGRPEAIAGAEEIIKHQQALMTQTTKKQIGVKKESADG